MKVLSTLILSYSVGSNAQIRGASRILASACPQVVGPCEPTEDEPVLNCGQVFVDGTTATPCLYRGRCEAEKAGYNPDSCKIAQRVGPHDVHTAAPTTMLTAAPSSSPTTAPTPSPKKAFETRGELVTAIAEYLESNVVQTYGSINEWDVGMVDNFSQLFQKQRNITKVRTWNEDIGSWDVSRATDLSLAFYGAASFNRDLSHWNTEKVRTVRSMFYGCTSFNGDVSNFDTARVTSLNSMFRGASAFNGDVSTWLTGEVTDMDGLFAQASSFNGNLSTWNTEKVRSLNTAFQRASSFEGNGLEHWNVGKVTDFRLMAAEATSFQQDLCVWGDQMDPNVLTYDMFNGATSCESTDSPNFMNEPVGPLCVQCLV